MRLKLSSEISLPSHRAKGGFDHAAYLQSRGLMYVAHTANDTVDIIDCREDRYLESIDSLKGVAGAYVSNERGLVVTSNRGENSISLFSPDFPSQTTKIGVGVRPNGLSFDSDRELLLVANVGDPGDPSTHTLTIVSTRERKVIGSIPVPGRTRWTVFDPQSAKFFVNIGDPNLMVTVSANNPLRIEKIFEIPAVGPHGLDFDSRKNCLYCACDSGELVTLNAESGKVVSKFSISGPPDVIFLNTKKARLYIAVGNPGVVDVVDTNSLALVETVATERGAHTIGFDFDREKIYAFLPESCRALVFTDS